jgi:tripartite-type tricarboxylate transporter receptor subunit TctC
MIGGSPTVTSLFVKDMPYDAFKDVTPVSLLGLLAYQLQVSRGLKVRNLKEFVDYAKANPGKINMGTVALGTHELEMLGILDVLGVKAALVPYKGIAPIWLGLISNELDATISASIPPQQRTGEIIAIAVGGERRNPSFNETMTFREQGYTLDPYASYTLWARAATPRTLLATIAAEAGAAAKSDDWVNRITRTLFIEGVGSNLEGAEKFVREEYARLKAIADRAGLKPQ